MVDAATEYAQHIPIRVIADMLGFPPEDGRRFREFVEDVLEGIDLPLEDRIERMEGLFTYLLEQVHDHLDNPRDDITSYLIGAEIFGQKLTAEHVTGAMALLLIAGIDTTWSAIGSSLWHLAPDAGRPRGGWWPSPGWCRPRWRSSSACTPRSPWPGWSRRTCTGTAWT